MYAWETCTPAHTRPLQNRGFTWPLLGYAHSRSERLLQGRKDPSALAGLLDQLRGAVNHARSPHHPAFRGGDFSQRQWTDLGFDSKPGEKALTLWVEFVASRGPRAAPRQPHMNDVHVNFGIGSLRDFFGPLARPRPQRFDMWTCSNPGQTVGRPPPWGNFATARFCRARSKRVC